MPIKFVVGGPIVRYVDQTTATIWLQYGWRHAVMLTVEPLSGKGRKTSNVFQTVQFGNKRTGSQWFRPLYIALPYVTDLEPSKWYRYYIEEARTHGNKTSQWPRTSSQLRKHPNYVCRRFSELAFDSISPVLRTLPKPDETLRLTFGSCRKWKGGANKKRGQDALDLFANWMEEHNSARKKMWPHLLLLIGDQIYADDVHPIIQKELKRRRVNKAKRARKEESSIVPTSLDLTSRSSKPAGINSFHLLDFEEFTFLYSIAYGKLASLNIQKVLANNPTLMIFDDHEISDDWNITGGWFAQMVRTPGWTEVIVDGLAAYWVYQGWGNLDPKTNEDDPRIQIMKECEKLGKDALEPLRNLILQRLDVDPVDRLRWSYQIPSSPPIFVLDVRNDRVLRPPEKKSKYGIYASVFDRIMSKVQMNQLFADLKNIDEPVILVSSVPLLVPSTMETGLTKARPLGGNFYDFEQLNPKFYEDKRREFDLEQWFAFPQSITDLVEMMDKLRDTSKKQRTFVILSGDVHFAYAMGGRFKDSATVKSGRPKFPFLVQLVSSPLWNILSKNDQKNVIELVSSGKKGDEQVSDLVKRFPVLARAFPAVDKIWYIYRGLQKGIEKEPLNKPFFHNPDFTEVYPEPSNKRSGQIGEGVLIGNSIATISIVKDHRFGIAMQTIWWTTGRTEKKLFRDAMHIVKLQ